MINTLIGGAIAAVMGALAGFSTSFWMDRRREKAKRNLIVDELIAEVEENLVISKSPVAREMWWMVSYKLNAYQAYKGQLFFLPKEIRTNLAAAAFTLEGTNTGITTHRLRAAFGQPVIEMPIETPEELLNQLEFCKRELIKWRKERSASGIRKWHKVFKPAG